MRKTILITVSVILVSISVSAQQKWDRPMQLRNCSINIQTDGFTATTFIEMEFYNPNGTEIEGLHRFELKPGQVITAFQLELNGKYRDGSIEEKWKATNAYNTIVGKRIDPALLTMENANNYSLRIYPVPSKGSRKVTMTIRQLLTNGEKELLYLLPLKVKDTLEHFNLNINVAGNGKPFAKPGLIAEKEFLRSNDRYNLEWRTGSMMLVNPISFAIPHPVEPFFCTKTVGTTTHFALRFRPPGERDYAIDPKEITVFWDASGSVSSRDISREINFLKQFISWHRISQLTIIPFNYRLQDTAIFYTENGFNSRWQQYLHKINYDGSTQLGLIDLAGLKTDMVLIFTDGNNTYGRSKPVTGDAPVYCINTSGTANREFLNLITGSSGGRLIDLTKNNLSTALATGSRVDNWLLNISSTSGKLVTEQALPLKWAGTLFINGTMIPQADTLLFHYGNNSGIKYIEKIPVDPRLACPVSAIDRVTMLHNFENTTSRHSWSDIIDFGLQEKVVTPHTAYIVLERVEDYVKYNIAPPKELEAECEKLNYVKRDTRFERKRFEAMDGFEILSGVVNIYNQKIRNWDANEKPIALKRTAYDTFETKMAAVDNTGIPQLSTVNDLSGRVAGLQITGSLDEVVVIGYGMSRKNSMTGAVAHIRGADIFTSVTTIEQALQGRVAGLYVTNPTGIPGSPANISIRGSSSLNGNRQPLYVVDGMPVSGNINDIVNLQNIDHITVLKDLSATAIYGSRAANGAIIIATKKGIHHYNFYNNKPYRLKDMEDMEYVQELKDADGNDKMIVYGKLKEAYGGEALFYFDVAQHMFETGFRDKAFEILMNATEASNGNPQVLHATAYILESWKYFKEALTIYEELANDNSFNLEYYRGMAWAHYRLRNYQQAVDILHKAIMVNAGQQESLNQPVKAIMLGEMNAIISMHKNELDVSAIHPALLKSLPVDLRIVIEGNDAELGNISIREPGGEICSAFKPLTKNGGNLAGGGSWYHKSPVEYQVKKAPPGKYRISVNYHARYPGTVPSLIRITKFKNYGKENQTIEIETVIMNQQSGEVEIAELRL